MDCGLVPRLQPFLDEGHDLPEMGLCGMGVAHRYGLVVVNKARGRHAAASVTWPGFIGTLSGMNETGLCMAMMVVYGVEDAEEGVPFAALFREALETQSTLKGVRDYIESVPRTCSNNR